MINTNDFDYDDGVTDLEEWINVFHVSLIQLYIIYTWADLRMGML